MAFDLSSILGSSVGDAFAKIVGVFKLSPEQAAQHATDLAQIQAQLQESLQKSLDTEVSAQADIIKAEANSQSWLPRNVRPLIALVFAIPVAFNILVPVIARLWSSNITPIVVDPLAYSVIKIYLVGYVGVRSFEKFTNTDK